MSFRDHFAGVAAAYAEYRPAYPMELFDWLESVVPDRNLAWDCACGSGQATAAVARRFQRVVATDASLAQLHNAPEVNPVIFAAAPAESSPLGDQTVDLVTIASALHWFVGDAFFDEVRRVLAPRGVVAAWTYGLPEVADAGISAIVTRFFDHSLGPYWPDEVRHVMNGYRDIRFPFAEIEPPRFDLRAEWSLNQFLGFMGTWSATARYREIKGTDPVGEVAGELAAEWGEATTRRTMIWRLALRVGTV